MPQDSGPINARVGTSCSRQYPYAVEAPRPRPWRRKALDVGLAACIGGGLALVLLSWAAAPW
jgi:hypothetical protein